VRPLNSACLILFVVLSGCSRDPQKQKAAYFASGSKYVAAGKYPEAVIQFRNAIEIDPGFAAAHYQLAQAYGKLQSPQQAYRELVATVGLEPGNADAQLELATFFIAARRYEEAQKAAEKILAVDAHNAKAHAVLGEMYGMRQMWLQAIQELETATRLDPARVETYAQLSAAFLASGQPSEAEATLRTAAERRPDSADARVNLGRFYLSQHRLTEAETAMRAAIETAPRAPLPRVLLIRVYMEADKLAEAERLCLDLKKLAPNDPDGYGALAFFYEATGQKEKAAREFRTLVTQRPKDPAIKAHLIGTLLDLNLIDEANGLNEEVLKNHPGDPGALIAKGRILILRQSYAEAKATLEAAVQANPQSAAGFYFLGVAENFLGLAASAQASFAHALELSPGWEEASLALADTDLRSGDYDAALRFARDAQTANPNSTSSYVIGANAAMGKGDLLLAEDQIRAALARDPVLLQALQAELELRSRQGRIPEVAQHFSMLALEHPQNASLDFLLGLAYFKEREFAKAEENVGKAVAIDPMTPDAYALLAEIAAARGTPEKAVAWYRMAIAHNPAKAENYMALAGLYGKQGKWEETKQAAERAHTLDPESPFIANNLADLYLDHGGDLNTAFSLAQQAWKKLPDSPVVSDTLGWAYYKIGSAEAAVALLASSVRRDPHNPMYNYHLGVAYAASGRFSDSRRSLERALSGDPNFPYAAEARKALSALLKASH
jgi:tetratricopeptide (TPR) repeat protein